MPECESQQVIPVGNHGINMMLGVRDNFKIDIFSPKRAKPIPNPCQGTEKQIGELKAYISRIQIASLLVWFHLKIQY